MLIALDVKYHENSSEYTVIKVLRGVSKNPLWVSAVGIETNLAAHKIENMHGEHRIPAILKKVDQLTRQKDSF